MRCAAFCERRMCAARPLCVITGGDSTRGVSSRSMRMPYFLPPSFTTIWRMRVRHRAFAAAAFMASPQPPHTSPRGATARRSPRRQPPSRCAGLRRHQLSDMQDALSAQADFCATQSFCYRREALCHRLLPSHVVRHASRLCLHASSDFAFSTRRRLQNAPCVSVR